MNKVYWIVGRYIYITDTFLCLFCKMHRGIKGTDWKYIYEHTMWPTLGIPKCRVCGVALNVPYRVDNKDKWVKV